MKMTCSKFVIVALGLCAILLSGCGKKSTAKVINSKHVKIGFIGLTCEAPIYYAYEAGLFKEEGLEPELVKCSWANYKDNLALGSYDITHHLVMYFLKPIEQGLDVRFVGGVHTGCLRVQTGVNSPIQKIQDLKGKRIDANPDTAARATRAILKGAKWVQENPKAAAQLAVDKKYLASTVELNTVALSRLKYIPSVSIAEQTLYTAAKEMREAKMLSPTTDTDALAKRAFHHLEGVTDEWIKTAKEEEVPGGQVDPNEDIRLYAALILKDVTDACCATKLYDQPDE